jgi:cytidylate kinase
MIVAIDGKVATGKSSVAKGVAHKLGLIYFDTGAMYRCFTWAILKHGIQPDDLASIKNYLKDFNFEIRVKDGEKRYFVEGEDVSEQIRQEKVTSLVSPIASIPFIREKLVEIQRSWAKDVNAIFEGRDIGTVVFPNADFKIFLTASSEIRAQRRLKEWEKKFPEEAAKTSFEKMLQEINQRDFSDSTRKNSPLKMAKDAIEIDTSNMTLEEVIDKVVSIVKK